MFETLENGTPPTRGSKYSACVDLYASLDVVIGAGETKVIGLGVCLDFEKIREIAIKSIFDIDMYTQEEINSYHIHNFKNSHYLQLMLRSSLGAQGLILPNGVGIIDLDYKDEIKMIVHNPFTPVHFYHDKDMKMIFKGRKDTSIKINAEDCIAQITLLEHKSYLFGIDTEEERTGGLGSTGS
ncbi:MAG: hypothetical protein COB42_06820 [Sulfurimonas sp.]|nr:MAG: hypothetical protein COB42_08750 [Sulfurimonas sp.]PHQ89531.1 MAG: hypothetical protein COB42_06820 [Sulfurimonas sp.]